MEYFKLVVKGWLKTILKPIVLKEILDDINLASAIFYFIAHLILYGY